MVVGHSGGGNVAWGVADARPDAVSRVIFVDTESSNWTYDPVRGQFYWHRFFSHQPDLNYENPAVQEAMKRGLGQLIIYPEGTRTVPGERRPWKGGVVTLYAASDLPCQPVATNAGMFWPKGGMRVRPGVAVIEFLDPVPPGLPASALLPRVEPTVENASDRLMSAAGLAIPPR